MRKHPTFDLKCYELAEHFLQDDPELDTEPNRKTLAYAIQSCVEEEMDLFRTMDDRT